MMKPVMYSNTLALVILIVSELLSMGQTEARGWGATPAEIAVLPPFCKAKLSPDPADDAQYSSAIGPDWLHIHHYCYALTFTNRYYQDYADKPTQHDDLNQALNNYNYVLSHASPGFWMRPEIHTQKGRLLAAAKHYAEAVSEIEQALKGNPDYAPAYAALSDIYADLGQKSKSLATVEQGLQHVPDNNALQRHYKLLTGKTFVPPPLSAEQAAQKNQPPGTSTETPDTQAAMPASAAQANEPPTSVSQPADAAGKIGSPTNPYCRFCPD